MISGNQTRAASPVAAPAGAPGRLFTLGDLLFWVYLCPAQWMAAKFPAGLVHLLGKLAGPLMQFQARRRARTAAAWMIASGCATVANAGPIARRSLTRSLSSYLDELILMRPDARRELHCNGIDGWEHYQRALAAGNGVILLSGHFSAIRVATAYLRLRGESILSVHNQLPPNREGGRLGRSLMPRFTELRHRAYPEVVYIQDPQCSLKIFRQLRGAGAVRVQFDGVPGGKSVAGNLLGVPWRVPAGIFDILRISNCAVVPIAAAGCSRGFRIRFDPALTLERGGSRQDFERANLPGLLGTIEKQILEHPEEWLLWTHQQTR